MKTNHVFAFTCVLLAIVIRLSSLGYPALSDPSEGRYATIAAEMAQTNDWITQQTFMDGQRIPFLGKPPLHAWLTSLAYKSFGTNEWSARLPSFLACLFICGAAAIFARRFFGAGVPMLSVLLLLSSGAFFVLAGGCLTDPVLTACVTASFVTFACAIDSQKRHFWAIAFAASLGLGMLTKGPVALALPAIAGVLFFFFRGTRQLKLHFPWLLAAVCFVAVAAPWFWVVEMRNPGFLRYFFLNENLFRFLFHEYGDRYGSGHRLPFGMVWVNGLLAFAPWTVLAIFFPGKREVWLRMTTREKTALKFVFAWALSPFLLFTFARQISFSYVLPALPAMSIALAAFTVTRLKEFETQEIRTFFRGNIFLSIVVSSALFLAGIILREETETIGFSAVILLVFLGLAFWMKRIRQPNAIDYSALSAASTVFTLAVVLLAIDDSLDRLQSSKGVVEYVEHLSHDDISELGFLNKTPQSAYFYAQDSDGATCRIVTLDRSDIDTTKLDYVAARKKDIGDLPEMLKHFSLRGDFGSWLLFKRIS